MIHRYKILFGRVGHHESPEPVLLDLDVPGPTTPYPVAGDALIDRLEAAIQQAVATHLHRTKTALGCKVVVSLLRHDLDGAGSVRAGDRRIGTFQVERLVHRA
jgi:hypothetical protein